MLSLIEAIEYIMDNCEERMQGYDCIENLIYDINEQGIESFEQNYLDVMLGLAEDEEEDDAEWED